MDWRRISSSAAKIRENLKRLDDISVSVEEGIADRGEAVRSNFDNLQLFEQERLLADLISWAKAKERNYEKIDSKYFASVESFQSFFVQSLTNEIKFMGKQIDKWDNRLKGIMKSINGFHYRFHDIWDKMPKLQGPIKNDNGFLNLQLEISVPPNHDNSYLGVDDKIKHYESQQKYLLDIIKEMGQLMAGTKAEVEELNLLYLETKSKLSDVMVSMDQVREADNAKEQLIAKLKEETTKRNSVTLNCSAPLITHIPGAPPALCFNRNSIFNRDNQPKAHWNLVFDEVLNYYHQLEPEIRVIREVIEREIPVQEARRSIQVPLDVDITQDLHFELIDSFCEPPLQEHEEEPQQVTLKRETTLTINIPEEALEEPQQSEIPKQTRPVITLRIDDRSKSAIQTEEQKLSESSSQTQRIYKKTATSQTDFAPKPPETPKRIDFRTVRKKRELSMIEEAHVFEYVYEEPPVEIPVVQTVVKVKKRNCKSQRAVPPPPLTPQAPKGNPMMSVALGTPQTNKNCVTPPRSARYGVWSSGKKQHTPLVAVKSMRESPKNEGMKLPHPYEIRRKWRETSDVEC